MTQFLTFRSIVTFSKVSAILVRLGSLYKETSNPSEAVNCYNSALLISQLVKGADHTDTKEIEKLIAEADRKTEASGPVTVSKAKTTGADDLGEDHINEDFSKEVRTVSKPPSHLPAYPYPYPYPSKDLITKRYRISNASHDIPSFCL